MATSSAVDNTHTHTDWFRWGVGWGGGAQYWRHINHGAALINVGVKVKNYDTIYYIVRCVCRLIAARALHCGPSPHKVLCSGFRSGGDMSSIVSLIRVGIWGRRFPWGQ